MTHAQLRLSALVARAEATSQGTGAAGLCPWVMTSWWSINHRT